MVERSVLRVWVAKPEGEAPGPPGGDAQHQTGLPEIRNLDPASARGFVLQDASVSIWRTLSLPFWGRTGGRK